MDIGVPERLLPFFTSTPTAGASAPSVTPEFGDVSDLTPPPTPAPDPSLDCLARFPRVAGAFDVAFSVGGSG